MKKKKKKPRLKNFKHCKHCKITSKHWFAPTLLLCTASILLIGSFIDFQFPFDIGEISKENIFTIPNSIFLVLGSFFYSFTYYTVSPTGVKLYIFGIKVKTNVWKELELISIDNECITLRLRKATTSGKIITFLRLKDIGEECYYEIKTFYAE